jgi:hypothetical protein
MNGDSQHVLYMDAPDLRAHALEALERYAKAGMVEPDDVLYSALLARVNGAV